MGEPIITYDPILWSAGVWVFGVALGMRFGQVLERRRWYRILERVREIQNAPDKLELAG